MPLQFDRYASLRVVDAIFLANADMIALATTGRDIRFYTTSTGACTTRLIVDAIVTSMDYTFDTATDDTGHLVYGDIAGNATSIRFHAINFRLFETSADNVHQPLLSKDLPLPATDGISTEEEALATARPYRLHHDIDRPVDYAVVQLKIFPSINAIISSR
jgi:hypothetical protein